MIAMITLMVMASITIRNVSDEAKQLLRVKAARAGMSLEGFLRDFLHREAMHLPDREEPSLLDLSQELFGEDYGMELDLPTRDNEREVVDFRS